MSILDTLQAKVDAIDSDSTMSEILQLMYNVKDHPYKSVYDSAGLMPTDSAYLGSIAYSDNRDTMYVFTNIDSGWKLLDSDAATPEPLPYTFQGSVSGYVSGGDSPPLVNVIEKFPFSSDANATDVGDLLAITQRTAGQSSSTDGYNSGGAPPVPADRNVIQKFPFATDANATDVGDLTVARYGAIGQSSSDHGYTSGGEPGAVNTIDKFTFSADANATDVGDLTNTIAEAAGQSSSDHGYVSGGNPANNVIQKFTFSADANATDVGDLTSARYRSAGQNSDTHGYNSGGALGAPTYADTNIIEKFSFTTDGNATDVGDVTIARRSLAGQSSTTHGYSSGGYGPNFSNIIDKFPFSTDTNASDVGDLTASKYYVTGQQI